MLPVRRGARLLLLPTRIGAEQAKLIGGATDRGERGLYTRVTRQVLELEKELIAPGLARRPRCEVRYVELRLGHRTERRHERPSLVRKHGEQRRARRRVPGERGRVARDGEEAHLAVRTVLDVVHQHREIEPLGRSPRPGGGTAAVAGVAHVARRTCRIPRRQRRDVLVATEKMRALTEHHGMTRERTDRFDGRARYREETQVHRDDDLRDDLEAIVQTEEIVRDVQPADERALDGKHAIVHVARFGGRHDILERGLRNGLGSPSPEEMDRLFAERSELTLKCHAQSLERALRRGAGLGEGLRWHRGNVHPLDTGSTRAGRGPTLWCGCAASDMRTRWAPALIPFRRRACVDSSPLRSSATPTVTRPAERHHGYSSRPSDEARARARRRS